MATQWNAFVVLSSTPDGSTASLIDVNGQNQAQTSLLPGDTPTIVAWDQLLIFHAGLGEDCCSRSEQPQAADFAQEATATRFDDALPENTPCVSLRERLKQLRHPTTRSRSRRPQQIASTSRNGRYCAGSDYRRYEWTSSMSARASFEHRAAVCFSWWRFERGLRPSPRRLLSRPRSRTMSATCLRRPVVPCR